VSLPAIVAGVSIDIKDLCSWLEVCLYHPSRTCWSNKFTFLMVVPSGAVVPWWVVPSEPLFLGGSRHQEPLFLPGSCHQSRCSSGGRAIRSRCSFWWSCHQEPLFLLVWSCHQEPLFLLVGRAIRAVVPSGGRAIRAVVPSWCAIRAVVPLGGRAISRCSSGWSCHQDRGCSGRLRLKHSFSVFA